MLKNILSSLTISLSTILLSPAFAQDDLTVVADQEITAAAESYWTLSGVSKNETAFFTNVGPVIGKPTTTVDRSGHSFGELLKFENSLNLFINGELDTETTIHAQLNLIYETEGISGFKGDRRYSQNDYLRELYLDKKWGNVDLRLGKQQVVWGTADGIKLLDIVNPTDWREFVQNTMEDSRIPVWMANVEMPITETGSVQLLVAQNREHAIPGINQDGDSGHPFIMKGVDSISGQVNGFRNITPALGGVANTFSTYGGGALNTISNASVQNFVDNNLPTPWAAGFGAVCNGHLGSSNGSTTNANCLNDIVQRGDQLVKADGSGANSYQTNLIDGAAWDANSPDSVFEYMPNATFATFDSFVNATTSYRRDYPNEWEPNLGIRYKNILGDDINFSLNYLWHYDPNPSVEIHWENSSGQPLTVTTTTDSSTGLQTVHLYNPSTASNDCSADAGKQPCTLVFTEKLNRVHSLGFAFDTSIDQSKLGPIVMRGEFLYQHGTKLPVIDRAKLNIGDLVGGMSMEKSNQIKYVLGADLLFFTNLLVSGQFIQFINLDFIDGQIDNGRYSADQATLHLSNNLQKGNKHKEFYSLFLSKPFGNEQQGRINNITIYEEGGGFWNLVDVEYAFNEELIASAEWNHYWGDENTLFGQFDRSGNLQMGIKYLF